MPIRRTSLAEALSGDGLPTAIDHAASRLSPLAEESVSRGPEGTGHVSPVRRGRVRITAIPRVRAGQAGRTSPDLPSGFICSGAGRRRVSS